MAQLVSPGVSVTIIDESFYIPAAAPTVPLIFIATRRGKTQPNGISVATGTLESGVVRAISSIGQSVQLYGIPYFWRDTSEQEFHGDARNEYGLFALNQFLGVGNLAYVVRANIDTTDAPETFIGVGIPQATGVTRVAVGNGTMGAITVASPFVKPETINVIFTKPTEFTVIGSESGIIGTNTPTTMAFSSTKFSFTITAGSTPFVEGDYFEFRLVYVPTTQTGTGNGTMTNIVADVDSVPETWTITFSDATNFTVTGSVTTSAQPGGTVGVLYDNNYINFVINAGTTPFANGDTFTLVLSQINLFNPLGADDAAKRIAIKTAIQAEININEEIRSEVYEYNLIVCPGYWECSDELVKLSNDVYDEAFVISEVPFTKTPEQAATWAMTAERVRSQNIAYYYPGGIASNLNGRDVYITATGIALRTYAYSDNLQYVWFAPAGVTRGTVTGVADVGYLTGTLGTPTTFVPAHLNQGQRDLLYKFFQNINPITFFPGRGIIIWGQKTSYGATSALDRVNVMRLLMYIKRALRKGAFPFVFEPNDKITRDNLKAAADGFLNNVMALRGLYDFVTLCDESNNTPFRIDNNELHLDVALKPVKAAEFIYIPIRVLSTGAPMPG